MQDITTTSDSTPAKENDKACSEDEEEKIPKDNKTSRSEGKKDKPLIALVEYYLKLYVLLLIKLYG